VAFGRRPTRALGDFHRAVLTDPTHSWEHLFAELAILLDLAGGIEGSGTAAEPWRALIADAGPVSLSIAAWDVRDAQTPAGEQRLRIGLLARGDVPPATMRWLSELLAIDLPEAGPAAVRLLGWQVLEAGADPIGSRQAPMGLTVGADSFVASARWQPGSPLTGQLQLTGLAVSSGADAYGPVTWTFPGISADLDLGPAAVDMLRLLLAEAVHAWGGEAAYILAGLSGLHRGLAWLPPDWPVLEAPGSGSLADLLGDPGAALRDLLMRLLTGISQSGEPFAVQALRTLGELLRAGQPQVPDSVPVPPALPGSGTYADPWSIPLPTSAEASAEILLWLDPAGPPADWGALLTAQVAGVADGQALASLLTRAASFDPRLRDLLHGRDPDELGRALDVLAAWLESGDGLVPLAAALPSGPTWLSGSTVAAPHALIPQDPQAIAQVAAQLSQWAVAGDTVAVYVSAALADRTCWDDLLAVVDPSRPAGAHLDLRALPNPADVDLSLVTTVADNYTADLLAEADQLPQLERVVLRVQELTGTTQVILVAHSTAGVTARLLAAERPDLVAGLITLGTPHGGSSLAPLLEPSIALAVRVAAGICAPIDDTAHGTVVQQLALALDGCAGPLGAPTDIPEFGGVPGDLVDTVPGLAIGSALGGQAIGLLTGATVAGPATAISPPTHVALGFRTRLDLPPSTMGEIEVKADARIDLVRVRVAPGAVEPDRPATAAALALTASRPGGWLVGAETAGPFPRVRWLEAGTTVRPGAPGAVAAEPWLRLQEAGAGAVASGVLTLTDQGLASVLDALLAELESAAADTPAAMLLRLIRSAGLVVDTVDGARSAVVGIEDLGRAPTQTLLARRDDLLDVIRDAMGLPSGPFVLAPDGYPVELSLDIGTGLLRLRTLGDIGLPDPLSGHVDVQVDLRAYSWIATAALMAGPVELALDSNGAVTIAADPWLPRQSLRPFDPAALQSALAAAAPRLALSAAVTTLVGNRLSSAIGPIDLLLVDPVGWLRQGGSLGAGGHLDGAKVNALLEAIADFLELDASAGLGLPGGYLVSASGSDPARLNVSGSFGSAATATIALDLSIDVHGDGHVTPAATITIGIALPGDWGTIAVAFGLDESGVSLVVTPDSAGPIRLLPTVDGLATLASGATQLLPKLLQELVTWIQGQPGAHDVLAVALDLAGALGIYADDSDGFQEPARAARLRAMLQPGWLEHEITDPGAVADLVAGLFGPAPYISLPADMTVTRAGDRIRWAMPVFAGCAVSIEVGWTASGVPQVLVGVTGLDTGPVTIIEAKLGYDDGLVGSISLRVEPGGELEFFTPEIEVGIDGTAFSARLLPVGVGAQDDLAIVIAPVPQVTITPEGAFAVVGAWLVPLVTRFLLPSFESVLDQAMWSGGPSARDVLDGAGLVDAAPAPLALSLPLPSVPEIALGALAALMDNATVRITDDLAMSAHYDTGRFGVRLSGRADIVAEGEGGISVSVRFGDATWLTDQDGVTVWILRDAPGAIPPLAIDPSLVISGLGAYFSGAGTDPLIEGAVSIGSLGALVFFDMDFMQAGQLHLTVNNLGASIEAVDAQIALDTDDADSFVAKILPKELQAPFSLALAYRHQKVEIHGGVGEKQDGIELTFPLDLDLLGILFLRELFLAGYVEDSRTTAVAAISGNASLGPIAINVTRVGLQVVIDGHGPQFGFKPPDGFGLSLDASVVKAGGYLLVQGHRYVGAIEIAVLQKFQLTAIGIVTTANVDGSPGFSLLLLITVQLPVPIPIGYGFFFSGAGGLLGLNRAMDVDRIRDGLRAGTADSILFPTDILNRIDTIVRDLEESFPQNEGHFLIGPMIAIQWMNPALVTLKVGLIIEIAPQPNIAILGVLRLALPTPDEAVVDIKVAFLGSIDFGAGLLSFDAAIYDSFIGYGDFKLSLEGDIAIRVSWGASPDLVASIGGFHPSYTPAAHLKLPKMRRLTLALLKDNPSITLRLYFAVTSNTVQMGAQLQLYVGVAGFSISGDMGFDVLVQIVPFLLDAHLWANLAVRAGDMDICSLSLDLRLTGPTPWVARGRARFSVLFITVTVEVEATAGDEQQTSLPNAPIFGRLIDELTDPKSWSSELSADAATGVSLLPVPAGTLVVDAGGLLVVRQNLIPLATDIGLVGPVPPADIRRAEISEMRFGAAPTRHEDVLAPYAPSAFAGAPTADADRLRAPAFEQRPTGVRALSGDALASSFVLAHNVAYERIIIDDPDQPSPAGESVDPPVSFGTLVAGGAAGSSSGAAQRRRAAEAGSVVRARHGDQLFGVTTIGRLTALDDNGQEVLADAPGAVLTRTDAEARLAALEASGSRFQLVPEVQLAR
jgi:hypothetical protein